MSDLFISSLAVLSLSLYVPRCDLRGNTEAMCACLFAASPFIPGAQSHSHELHAVRI